MRRMYSEQELTRIIGEVFDQKLESGALDSSISDAVDAYLVEHPVDITALEGQTIAPAVINATTSISAPAGTFTSINGESSPSVKPIYYHPIYLAIKNDAEVALEIQLLILNNSSTKFTTSTIIPFLKSLMDDGALINVNGYVKVSSVNRPAFLLAKGGGGYDVYYYTDSTSTTINLDTLMLTYPNVLMTDGRNKIN